ARVYDKRRVDELGVVDAEEDVPGSRPVQIDVVVPPVPRVRILGRVPEAVGGVEGDAAVWPRENDVPTAAGGQRAELDPEIHRPGPGLEDVDAYGVVVRKPARIRRIEAVRAERERERVGVAPDWQLIHPVARPGSASAGRGLVDHPVQLRFEMQVRRRAGAATARQPDLGARPYELADADRDAALLEVEVPRFLAAAVVENHIVRVPVGTGVRVRLSVV